MLAAKAKETVDKLGGVVRLCVGYVSEERNMALPRAAS